MSRRPLHQRLGPRLQPRVLLDQAVWLDAFEEHVALQERRIGGIDQGIFGAVEERAAALLVERLPKTRSGKILRGTMRSIADGEDYRMPATIDDPAILGEIGEALSRAGYPQKPST